MEASAEPYRLLAQIRFTQERSSRSFYWPRTRVGEGVNLQVAHLMINYDIPWNPNRLEQRFARIHRIGQLHGVIWSNVDGVTREGEVFGTLMNKLEGHLRVSAFKYSTSWGKF